MENNPSIVGVIPARMGSSRLPGKALAKIMGIPMIGHVYHRSKMSKLLDEVYVLTPDQEIIDYVNSIGAKTIKDKRVYRGCSSATADVVLDIENEIDRKLDVIVLIQGDEPMVVPEMIDLAVRPILDNPSIEVVNLMAPIRSTKEHNDPNCIKVVTDLNNFALYFSREPIPSRKKYSGEKFLRFKQVCAMPFTRDFLLKLNDLTPTPLEEIESIDMNRVLEYGYKVKMVLQDFETYGVDVAEDLVRVKKLMINDPLIKKYA